MELESTNLISIKNTKNELLIKNFTYEKDVKKFLNIIFSVAEFINTLILIILLIFFILYKLKEFLYSSYPEFFGILKKNITYYQDFQHKFCDNILDSYNKELEKNINLYNVSLKHYKFDMYLYKNNDYFSSKIIANQSLESEETLHMLNALNYYANKYDYLNSDIVIIDIGSNAGWYAAFLGNLNFTVLSFESMPENIYLFNKNFCRNNKALFGNISTVTVINKILYPKETYCDYYKDLNNSKKYVVLCDKTKEKNFDKNYIKKAQVKSEPLSKFIPLINNKRMTLLRLDLHYEGEKAIESGKELISIYHIPFIFIEFNLSMFILHETKPQDFLRFFINNGYKISLNGFLSNEFINIEDILKTYFVKINLYLVYTGK